MICGPAKVGDGARKPIPGRRTAGSHVEHSIPSAGVILLARTPHTESFHRSLGNPPAPGRCPDLVVDNAELGALLEQAQHREEKILTACAINTARAKNHVADT